MDLELSDKVAVVLASSSGLGRAVAEALLAEGARVAISGRDRARLERTVADLAERHGARVRGEALDVTDRSALARHLEGVREQWKSIHALVLNAGGPPPATAQEVDDAGLDAAFDLTLRSAVHAAQIVLPWMKAQRFGRVVALTSMSVRQPNPTLVYSNVMRAGLTAWLKTLSREVAGDGVLVNSVCTGLFDTERLEELFVAQAERQKTTPEAQRAKAIATIPAARLGTCAEFGSLVAFLCSPRCSYLAGVAIPVDGGWNTASL